MSDQQVWLEAVIQEYERKHSTNRVISVEEKVLVGAGENYLSQVTQLVVQVVRGDGEIVTESFILKQLPAGTHTRDMVFQGGFNFIEFTVYRDVLSSMDLLLKEKNIADEPIWPRCFTMKPYDKIVFEDLTACGYKMANRLTGLDLDHCTLVAQNLGLFHALGLVLKDRGILSNLAFGQHMSIRQWKEHELWINLGYKKLLDEMENWGDEWQPILTNMKEKLPEYGHLIIDLLRAPENGFTVLNHGDAWTNNILFKYNAYTGKPILMRFLDFQLSFLGTPAHDLTYFLTVSPDMNVRREHKKHLIRTYHQSLVFNMERLGVAQKPPTLEYIHGELKRVTYLRFLFMTSVLVMITKKPEDTYDIEKLLEEEKEAETKGQTAGVDQFMSDMDDYLRSIYQLTVKDASDEGTL